MARHVKAGTRVSINYAKGMRSRTPFDIGSGRQEADHGQSGAILEDGRIGPDAGWDVYDVRLDDGRETFAYGFNLQPAPKQKTAHSSKRAIHSTKIAGDAATQFTAGFDYVLKDWKAGMPWEQSIDLATTPADQRSHAFTSGARAAGEALAGWLDEARRKAKHFGLSEAQREALIEKSRYESLFPAASHATRAHPAHHATKKSPAQLQREIDEALSRRKPRRFAPGAPNNDDYLRFLDDVNDPPRTGLIRAHKDDRIREIDKPARKSKMSHAAMKAEESAPRILARWESRSGKHWVELKQHAGVTIANAMDPTSVGGRAFTWYGYTSPGSSGSLAATTSAAAIAEMEQRVNRGDFLPDAAKTPMKRVR